MKKRKLLHKKLQIFFRSEHSFCILYSENLNKISIWMTIRKFYM